MLTREEMMDMFRDLMVAMDVGKKAELGYFDVEIDTYGCTYLDNGERNYILSGLAGKLYDFLEESALEDRCPCAMLSDNFRKPLPKGLKDMLELELKKDLAKQLQERFPAAFMEELQQMATQMHQNQAAQLLHRYMDQLEATFNREQFDLFESTLVLTVGRRKLSVKEYQILLARLNEERKNISNELRPHDIFYQAFYAFAYKKDGRIDYFYDGRKDFVYQNRYQLEQEGAIVSPIFTKNCFYNYTYRLIDARKDFAKSLPNIFHEDYMQLLEDIHNLSAAVGKDDYKKFMADCIQKYGSGVE